jgi:hypothetical protein
MLRLHQRFPRLIAALLIAISIIAFIDSVMSFRESRDDQLRAQGFSKTLGTVRAVGMESVGHGAKSLDLPIVEYSYVVNGAEYKNDDVFLKQRSGSEDWASSIAGRFLAGSPCDVYYDPNLPKTSVLIVEAETGESTRVWLEIVIASFTLVAALWILTRDLPFKQNVHDVPKRAVRSARPNRV